jgi:hypothetical protein
MDCGDLVHLKASFNPEAEYNRNVGFANVGQSAVTSGVLVQKQKERLKVLADIILEARGILDPALKPSILGPTLFWKLNGDVVQVDATHDSEKVPTDCALHIFVSLSANKADVSDKLHDAYHAVSVGVEKDTERVKAVAKEICKP